MQRVVRSALVGLTIAGLTACGDKVTVPPPVTPAPDTAVVGITVTPPTLTLTAAAPGNTGTLVAAVSAGPQSPARTVTWTSSNTTVATVVGTGNTAVVTGRAAGQSTISATVAGSPSVVGAAVVTVGGATGGGGAPTVTISTINQTVCGIGGCNSVPANLANVNNQLDVTLNVEPNGQVIRTIRATLTCPNSTPMVVEQTIAGTVQSDLAAEAAEVPVTLSFNTAQFNGTTGAVALRNGQCTISALAITASGQQSAVNTTTFTLNNLDAVVITSAFAAFANAEGVTTRTTANDAGGLPWRGGAVTISALPVLYSGRTVASVAITLPGATGATQTVTAAPFSATWSATATSGSRVTGLTLVCQAVPCSPNDVSGSLYEVNGTTPKGVTPTIAVIDAAGNDVPLVVNNAGVINATTFRLDNTAPQPPTTFVIPGRQFSWVNAAYTFRGTGGASFGATGTTNYVACGDGPANAAANPPACNPGPIVGQNPGAVGQIGVSANAVSGTSGLNGQTTFSYYAIPVAAYVAASGANGTSTSATSCSTTGWTKLTSGTAGDLADSPNSGVYVVRVFEIDNLLNARCTDLANAPNLINSGVFARGTFGVDKVAPSQTLLEPGNAACPAAGCVSADQKVNIAYLATTGGVVPSFQVSYVDFPAQSGFSTTPINTTVTRLAIDPATGVTSVTPGSLFGCPVGWSANNQACQTTALGGTIAADPNATGASSGIDGYYVYTGQIIDIARNTGNTVTRRAVVDRAAPRMGGVAVPSTVTGGQSASFATSAIDNLDLASADYTLNYVTVPFGSPAALNVRSQLQPIGTSVAFDNVLQTNLSFNLVVPFVIRSMATTTAAGAPQNNAAPASAIAVRAYDAADNASPPEVQAISAAALSQANPTNYAAPQANTATFTGTGFRVENGATNVSNCPAGCTPANATTVTLVATAQGTESSAAPAFQFQNPFSSVQFYYLDRGYAGASNEWILIGSVPAPSVTDNAAQTVRTFTWTLTTPFDPPLALGAPAQLLVIAVGVNAAGDGLSTAVNPAITLTNP